MITDFLEQIEDSIRKNVKCQAVSYFNGKEWSIVTYEQLKLGADEISAYLSLLIGNQWSYFILFLKITKTFPLLILSLLKTGVGFICLEDGMEDECLHYISELNVTYILCNIDYHEEHYLKNFISRFTFKKKFTVLGEVISLWSIEESSNRNGINNINAGYKFMYSIKTSGSTGLSKVVQVPHRCIIPNIRDLSEILQIKTTDVILLMTPITFDPSVIEVFLAFYTGCSLCILDKTVKGDPQLIIDALFSSVEGKISLLQITPSVLKRWNLSILQNHIFHSGSSLRAVILGGEEFPTLDEVKSWNVAPHISLYNIYGITEVSCWASINKVWPATEFSNDIGRPLSETLFRMEHFDENNQGELMIGSKTRICLVGDEKGVDIFRDGSPSFRSTGDIFKDVDGKLFFVGRSNDILKRWGTRFSLSEIEKTVRFHKNVVDCACVSVKLKTHIKLGLFIVQKSDDDIRNIEEFLKKQLPKVSWPDVIRTLPSLPLTDHGKVCKSTLRKLLVQRGSTLRQVFHELWERYTTKNIDGGNDFLSAGGDSLSALQFFNELKFEFADLPDTFLGTLFQKRSQEEIWQLIESSYNKKLSFQEDKSLADVEYTEKSFSLPTKVQNLADGGKNIAKTYLKGEVSVFCDDFCEKQHYDIDSLKLKEIFKYNLGKCVDASPLGIKFVNKRDVIIVGSHSGDVVALDVDDLKVISKCSLPDRVESSACISNCGHIYYIGCYDGCLYSIYVQSGMLCWKYKTGDIVKSTAIIYEENIIFGSYDKYLYCLCKDGKLKWKTKLKSPILTRVIVDNNVLFCATLGSIAALNARTSQLIWEHQHHPIFSTPVLSKNSLILADVKGSVQWINKETGEEENSFKAEDMIFSSLVKNIIKMEEIIIFGCHDCYVYCLKDGKLHWKTPLDSNVVSTPFCESSSELPQFIVCFSSTGKGYLLNFSTGKKICEYSLPGEVFSSPVILKNKIIVGCRDDNIYVLKIQSF